MTNSHISHSSEQYTLVSKDLFYPEFSAMKITRQKTKMLYLFQTLLVTMGKATGIGGIFFRYRNEKAMREWFEEALGLTPNDYGVLFSFNNSDSRKGYLQLGTFPENTEYFGDPTQQAMINFRVDNLVELEQHLRELGTVICNAIEEYEYGKFLHIEDPEGNRIELWEPVDNAFSTETQVSMS